MRRFLTGAVAVLIGSAAATIGARADAQEIQLTGPLAGAPAVRKLRLHRDDRFEVAPGVSFTLLDEYQRTIMPGLRATYHFTDWLGVGVWGGYGFQYTTGLSDELQEKAIDSRRCSSNPSSKPCRLTAVNLTSGNLADDQLAKLQWVLAPQITAVPFRGKLALFAELFVDTDVNFFLGPAIIGLQERSHCGHDEDGGDLAQPCDGFFQLESRVTAAPTFGMGLNFYPSQYIGFGAEWRGLPFAWNTAGFDNRGGGTDKEFPDNNINGDDSEFHFTSMLTVYVSVQFPTAIRSSD